MPTFKQYPHCKHCLSKDCRNCTGFNKYNPHLTKIQSSTMRMLRENQVGVLFPDNSHIGVARTNPSMKVAKIIDHTKYDLNTIRKGTITSLISKKLLVRIENRDLEFYEINEKML